MVGLILGFSYSGQWWLDDFRVRLRWLVVILILGGGGFVIVVDCGGGGVPI